MDTVPARVLVVVSLVLAAALTGCSRATTRSSVEASSSSAAIATAPAGQEPAASSKSPPGGDTEQSGSEGRIYTPESGSAERTAILDAVRKFHDTKDKFIVHEMLVQDDWALCTVSPEGDSESGVSYLALRRVGGQWVDVVASDSGETEDWKAGYRDSWLKFGVPSSLVNAYQFKTR